MKESVGEIKLERSAVVENAKPKVIIVLCSLFFGINFTQAISGFVLPLILKEYTSNAFLIGIILAIDPFFGFIVQPIVGLLSDRIWTPVGRRAFFIITAAPLAAICLLGLSASSVLWQIVGIIIIFQALQDVLWGSDHPLLADLVPPVQRNLVSGVMTVTAAGARIILLGGGIGYLMELNTKAVFYAGALIYIVFVMIPAFFLGEKKPELKPEDEREKMTFKKYYRDIMDRPMIRRFAFLTFTTSAMQNCVRGYIALYAVNSLSLSNGDFGKRWALEPFLSLVFAIPLGWLLMKKWNRQWTMFVCYGLFLVASVIGLFAEGASGLSLIAVFFALSEVINQVCFKPFFTEYLPPEKIGQLTGAVNILYGTGRMVAMIAMGGLVSLAGGNYRLIWVGAAVFCLLSIGMLFKVPDLRYTDQKV